MLGKTHFTNRIIWILLVFFVWYEVVDSLITLAAMDALKYVFSDSSPAMIFVLTYYAPLIASVAFFVLFCTVFRRNRFILGEIRPSREGRSMKMLWWGILLGFMTNFFCVLCALLHGDIKLYFEFYAPQIPLMVFAFICVLFQSASEELWCRGFLYERVNVHYPLWVAIVVNAVLFGGMHIFNDGISALAMTDLITCGLFYSLLRWYSGSIWTCIGAHTMWNFTQNFIFGLPNSGLVSEASFFHLDAATGISNWVYSYEFGVEGAVPAVLMEVLPIAVILWLAYRDGRLGELLESRESRGATPAEPPRETPEVEFPA